MRKGTYHGRGQGEAEPEALKHPRKTEEGKAFPPDKASDEVQQKTEGNQKEGSFPYFPGKPESAFSKR